MLSAIAPSRRTAAVDHRDAKTCQAKLSVMTFNVEEFFGPCLSKNARNCQNMSASDWNRGVAAVRDVIAEGNADVVMLQELGLTRLDVVPDGYKVAVIASTGEPGWKDNYLANGIFVRRDFDVHSS